jgi:hypothetical protein
MWFKIIIKFSKWNANFDKIYTLWKIHIYSTMINALSEQLYFILIKIIKDFIQKKIHMKKWENIKKDHQSFCKVFMLAPIFILTPICRFSFTLNLQMKGIRYLPQIGGNMEKCFQSA